MEIRFKAPIVEKIEKCVRLALELFITVLFCDSLEQNNLQYCGTQLQVSNER